jgi:hypothetical protein
MLMNVQCALLIPCNIFSEIANWCTKLASYSIGMFSTYIVLCVSAHVLNFARDCHNVQSLQRDSEFVSILMALT